MIKADADFFCCLNCKRALSLEIFDTTGTPHNNVIEGVLICSSCKIIYPISEGIPFLLDKGYYPFFDINTFFRKWQYKFNFSGYEFFHKDLNAAKIKQLNFYNCDSEVYDGLVMNTAFWRACDWNVLRNWLREQCIQEAVLDIGCGTGRSTVILAKKAKRILATDISIGMLRKALVKTKQEGINNVTYFLADAEDLPLKASLFSAVVSYGMLHHVADPVVIINSAKRLLKPKGMFFALENHASPLRPLFDLLMRVWKLWNEEAGTMPLFKIKEMRQMLRNSGMNEEIRTSVFLPPHLFNLIGFELAKKVLNATDVLCGKVPIVKNFGGQLVIKATTN